MASFCPHCGMQQPPHAAFCSRCGSALAPTSKVPRRTPIEPSVAWVLLIVFGCLGLHRFYLGGRHVGWGLAYLFTGAFCGIGWIVDLCFLSEWIDERNATL